MAFENSIITSIFGRRLGLQSMSSAQTGSIAGRKSEFLAGPDALRMGVTTVETTSVNLKAHGLSILSTVSSSAVFTIDPPIPGIEKTIVFNSTATSASPIYLRLSTGATITVNTSVGTTLCVFSSTVNAPVTLRLIGITTAVWGMVSPVSTAYIGQSTST